MIINVYLSINYTNSNVIEMYDKATKSDTQHSYALCNKDIFLFNF